MKLEKTNTLLKKFYNILLIMNWLILSFIAFLSMTAMIILINAQSKKGLSTQFILLAGSSSWILGFGIWSFKEGFNFSIDVGTIAIIFAAGILGVATNWLTFESSAKSPNAGFTFAITNSSPVLIALISAVFFSGNLSALGFSGIIICSAGVILMSKFSIEKRPVFKEKWVIQALVALVFSAVLSVAVTELIKKGLTTSFVLWSLAIIYTASFAVWVKKSGTLPRITKRMILDLSLIGVFTVVGNWTLYKAASLIPNPAPVFAINGTKPILIALLALVFLKNKLSLRQFFGMAISVAGVLILILSK